MFFQFVILKMFRMVGSARFSSLPFVAEKKGAEKIGVLAGWKLSAEGSKGK